jgi:hypothetical protein
VYFGHVVSGRTSDDVTAVDPHDGVIECGSPEVRVLLDACESLDHDILEPTMSSSLAALLGADRLHLHPDTFRRPSKDELALVLHFLISLPGRLYPGS